MSFFNEQHRNLSFSKKSKDQVILVDTESNNLSLAENGNTRRKPAKVSSGEFSLKKVRKEIGSKSKKASTGVTGRFQKPSYYAVLALVFSILLLRGIFMDGGFNDYSSAIDLKNRLDSKKIELSLENKVLAKEISRLEKSPSYLKKVVREQLGVIAPDEYILIFPES